MGSYTCSRRHLSIEWNRVTAPNPLQVTRLLAAARAGNKAAEEQLWSLVYSEIRAIAHGALADERRRGELQTTALSNEVYLRLAGNHGSSLPENRRQFFAIVGRVMRHLLVDDARMRKRLKRGGGKATIELRDDLVSVEYEADRVLAVHEALQRIGERDPGLIRLVELRFFAGQSMDQTAELLGISARQADIEWQFAKAQLYDLLS